MSSSELAGPTPDERSGEENLARIVGLDSLNPPDEQAAARTDSDAPMSMPGTEDGFSPFLELARPEWARLREHHPMTLTAEELWRLSGLNDPIDQREAEEIYLPLSRLLAMYVAGTTALHRVTNDFLGEQSARTPFVIGVAGSVAVGKSTTARVLRELLSRWPNTPRVDLVTTDGFLYPNSVLEERKLAHRKGFPESYDRRALLRFVADVKSGVPEVKAPKYDHLTYDILPDDHIVVHQPDVLIIEGLNVLQPARATEDPSSALAVSDYFDFSIYVDAAESDILHWFTERFMAMRRTAFADPESFFHRFSSLTDSQAQAMAEGVWMSINSPNLTQNILPTRGRAHLVLRKGRDHAVQNIYLRKL